MKNSSYSKKERGQSLVELALSITFLLWLLAGIVDLGIAFFSWVSLRDAAQEGALYGSLNPTDITGIQTRVRTTSNQPVNLADTTNVTINVTNGTACRGGALRVEVIYNYRLSMPLIGTILGSQSIPIRAEVTDTILAPACP